MISDLTNDIGTNGYICPENILNLSLKDTLCHKNTKDFRIEDNLKGVTRTS